MTPELIQRLITLVQKHGDRVVLADPAIGRAVVVLELEEYERLREGSTAVAVAPATSPAPAPRPEVQPPMAYRDQLAPAAHQTAPIEIPVQRYQEPPAAPQPAPAPQPKKTAQPSQKTAPIDPSQSDLTQEELLDKINRDIGAWKTAQDRKRTDELKSAVRPQVVERRFVAPPDTAPSALEDEERFFLEPIE